MSANTVRRESSPSADTTGGERQGSSHRNNGSKNSPSSTNLKPFTIGDSPTPFVKIDDEIHVAPNDADFVEDDNRQAQPDPNQDNGEYHYDDDPASVFSDDDAREPQATSLSHGGRGRGRGRNGRR